MKKGKSKISVLFSDSPVIDPKIHESIQHHAEEFVKNPKFKKARKEMENTLFNAIKNGLRNK